MSGNIRVHPDFIKELRNIKNIFRKSLGVELSDTEASLILARRLRDGKVEIKKERKRKKNRFVFGNGESLI